MTNPYTPTAKVLHLSDTHLGIKNRKVTGSGRDFTKRGKLNAGDRFLRAIEMGIDEGVDAVVHTGDVFDHDVFSRDTDFFEEACEKLQVADIPFYVTIGNHDNMSEVALQQLKSANEKGQIILTSKTGTIVPGGELAIYGIHNSDIGIEGRQPGVSLDWDEKDQEFSEPSTTFDGLNILCLHERVSPPYTPAQNPDVYLDLLLSNTTIDFDLILVGHEHSPPWEAEIQDIPVRYASPTARISNHLTDNDSFVNLIRFYSDGRAQIKRQSL